MESSPESVQQQIAYQLKRIADALEAIVAARVKKSAAIELVDYSRPDGWRLRQIQDRMNQYEVAQYLNVGVDWLRQMRRTGDGPPFTRGWNGEDRNRVFYSRAALYEWVKAHTSKRKTSSVTG